MKFGAMAKFFLMPLPFTKEEKPNWHGLRDFVKLALHLFGNNSCTQLLRKISFGLNLSSLKPKGFPKKTVIFHSFGSLCFAEQKVGFQNHLHTETAVSLLPSASLLFPKRVAGLREFACKLLQDNYKSWQAPSVLPMFLLTLRGPQPPHKAICLRSCWEYTNKLRSLRIRPQKATRPTPPAV